MYRTRHLLLGLLILLAGSTTSVRANDWMFQRSYFSHELAPGEPVYPVPQPRYAIRPAIPQRGPGFSLRATNRFNLYRLYNGSGYDTTIFREFQFEANPGAR